MLHSTPSLSTRIIHQTTGNAVEIGIRFDAPVDENELYRWRCELKNINNNIDLHWHPGSEFGTVEYPIDASLAQIEAITACLFTEHHRLALSKKQNSISFYSTCNGELQLLTWVPSEHNFLIKNSSITFGTAVRPHAQRLTTEPILLSDFVSSSRKSVLIVPLKGPNDEFLRAYSLFYPVLNKSEIQKIIMSDDTSDFAKYVTAFFCKHPKQQMRESHENSGSHRRSARGGWRWDLEYPLQIIGGSRVLSDSSVVYTLEFHYSITMNGAILSCILESLYSSTSVLSSAPATFTTYEFGDAWPCVYSVDHSGTSILNLDSLCGLSQVYDAKLSLNHYLVEFIDESSEGSFVNQRLFSCSRVYTNIESLVNTSLKHNPLKHIIDPQAKDVLSKEQSIHLDKNTQHVIERVTHAVHESRYKVIKIKRLNQLTYNLLKKEILELPLYVK